MKEEEYRMLQLKEWVKKLETFKQHKVNYQVMMESIFMMKQQHPWLRLQEMLIFVNETISNCSIEEQKKWYVIRNYVQKEQVKFAGSFQLIKRFISDIVNFYTEFIVNEQSCLQLEINEENKESMLELLDLVSRNLIWKEGFLISQDELIKSIFSNPEMVWKYCLQGIEIKWEEVS